MLAIVKGDIFSLFRLHFLGVNKKGTVKLLEGGMLNKERGWEIAKKEAVTRVLERRDEGRV